MKRKNEVPSFVKHGSPVNRGSEMETIIRRGLTKTVEYNRDGRIYASGAAYCTRQTVIGATGKSTEIQNAASGAYMTMGSAIEEMLLTAFHNQNVLLFKQYKLPELPGINMGGKIDAIVYVLNKIRCVEIKSCSSLPGAPKSGHLEQAQVYSAVTGLPASLVYFSRSVADYNGNIQLREFPLALSREDHFNTMFKVCYARLAIDANVIPPVPSGWTQANCGYCPFVPICWEDDELPGIAVGRKDNAIMMEQAKEWAAKLTTVEALSERRHGVLRHLEKNGTQTANELLAGTDWSQYE